MPKLRVHKREISLSIGGLLATAGGLLIKFWTHGAGLYLGGAISLIGIVLLLVGTFEVVPGTKILDSWNSELLYRSLADAARDSTIRLLQTSIPDVTRLIGALEDLLIHKDKQFRLRILLLDYENAHDVLLARVRLRVETPETHMAEIRADVDQFIQLKQRVDAAWKDSRSGAKLDLQIRFYSFLPFGSVLQIGEEHVFSGLFWNWTSSINGPMIAVKDKKSRIWECFEKHFTGGWESARPIFPQPEHELKSE